MRRKTTEEFIENAIYIHGNVYDYSLVKYKNNNTKVIIINKSIGTKHLVKPVNFILKGHGCSISNAIDKNEYFIIKSNYIHENKYDYSQVEYKNNSTKIKIKCNKCNSIFTQSPHNHLQGKGCPICSGRYSPTTTEIIKKFKKIHGNKYDYSLVVYNGTHTKVIIKCKKCDILFNKTPHDHLIHVGCPKCGKNRSIEKRKIGIENFIKRSIDIHGDNYDYSLVYYENTDIKVKIICKKHGLFEQTPTKHLQGMGCLKCGIERNTENQSHTKEKFVEKAITVHGYKYDYSLVNYTNNYTKVKIICSDHGGFEQQPSNHLFGQGCPKCGINSIKLTIDDFINRSVKIHGDLYDYSNVNYERTDIKILIKCKKCNITFNQTPNGHLMGKGCSNCKQSKGEIKIVKVLNKLNIEYEPQKKFEECKSERTLRFDFFISKSNTCIEFDGKHHYKPIEFYGGEKRFQEQQLRDQIKNDYCKDNNINLLRIPYTEFDNIEEIIKNKLEDIMVDGGLTII